jgi:hypothetical protein
MAERYAISSYCHAGGCVGVAAVESGGVRVRDEKHPHGPQLAFTAEEWAAFLAGVRNGEFDEAALRSGR